MTPEEDFQNRLNWSCAAGELAAAKEACRRLLEAAAVHFKTNNDGAANALRNLANAEFTRWVTDLETQLETLRRECEKR